MTARELLARNERIIADIEQMIRDAEYWNGLPHNRHHTPIDVEWERVMLSKLRGVREQLQRVLREGRE